MVVHFSPINHAVAVDRATARTNTARQTPVGASQVQTAFSLANLTANTSASSGSTGSAAGSGSTPSSTAPTSSGSTSGVNSLFPVATPPTTPAATAATTSTAPPTAESVFGANPWVPNPTGTGPTGLYTYNPYYFATTQTAQTVASMVGGQVVQMNAVSGGVRFVQNQPNEMVQLPNGAIINPGLVASFYTHGYPQSMVTQMIANEVANVTKGC